jgi:hypothetical protein
MKGFAAIKQTEKTARYWIACYTQEDEDVPFDTYKKALAYKPGQDKDKLILEYCRDVMRINKHVWELLVHQGPNDTPDNGDQITLRMSREQFRGSEIML